eukprot:TRINITY_DN12341_c0_g1_i1.p1 TRINITY_DN12341_c0_g1~~TRINITY_DN12341_c0_g1_i1.p1  ORF type:complete len:112 (-),score=14.33 TRINITY_DN12341_c0_g1_i1:33-368(-)
MTEWKRDNGSNQLDNTDKNDINLLLGSLRTQMSNIQTDYKTPASRGVCGICEKNITHEIIFARGRHFHYECFTCNRCHKNLGTDYFYYRTRLDQYCEPCYFIEKKQNNQNN